MGIWRYNPGAAIHAAWRTKPMALSIDRRIIAVALLIAFVSLSALAQTSAGEREIVLGGATFALGMSKDQVLGTLSRSYNITEYQDWSKAHKPDSLWWMSDVKTKEVKGGVKFREDKLYGAMVNWTPDSSESSDFASNLINLLERFSKQGATPCTLSTDRNTMPQQEQRTAELKCGLRSVVIEHDHFTLLVKGEKVQDAVNITEGLNW
jgi:hypothetical protein